MLELFRVKRSRRLRIAQDRYDAMSRKIFAFLCCEGVAFTCPSHTSKARFLHCDLCTMSAWSSSSASAHPVFNGFVLANCRTKMDAARRKSWVDAKLYDALSRVCASMLLAESGQMHSTVSSCGCRTPL